MPFRTRIVSLVAIAALLLSGVSLPASAEELPVSTPTPAPASSHKTAEIVGIAILAGVVVGTVILIEMHSHHSLKGCISSGSGGLQLQNLKDGKTYNLVGSVADAQPGQILQLRGSREKTRKKKHHEESDGELTFVVKNVKKDYGPCPAGAAAPSLASLTVSVVDANTQRPIPGATVIAGGASAVTDSRGSGVLPDLPTGRISATASAQGYDQKTVPIVLQADSTGQVTIPLQRHRGGGDIERSIGANGTVALRGVHFDTNSANLRTDSTDTLQQALTAINKRPNSHWVISGYTDSQGSADVNQNLSDQRAGAVMDWLIEHGVDESRLTAKGYGASHPVADNSTEEGRAQNRRVELTLVK